MRIQVIAVLVCCGLAGAQKKAVEEAWDLLAAGKREEAIRILRGVVKGNASDADARLLLGSVLAESGNRVESIPLLEEAVRLRPNSAEAHHALGEALHNFGERKASRAEFEKAVKLDSGFGQAQADLGAALFDAGELAAAGEHLDRGIQIFGRSADAAYPLYLRAKIHSEQGENEKAAGDLMQAVSLRPDFAEAWSDLGQARKQRMDEAGALAAFQRAVALSPEDAVAQTRLGAEYLSQGKAHEAVPHLREAVRLNRESQTALYSLQSALREDGQNLQAQEVKQRLTELLRNRDRASENALRAVQLNNEGTALERVGNLPAALEKYQAALALTPDHVGIRTNMAAALLRLGRWNEGIAELRESVRRDPDNTSLQIALKEALSNVPSKRN
ncbi:MAG TPA: tetratricopeptide repeat protein [Candidatus Solibacter sp.]